MKILREIHQWVLRYKLKKRCIFTGSLILDKNVVCEGGNKLCAGSTVLNVKLGYGSYIGDSSFVKNAEIGKYCCIARDVRTIIGNHPSSGFVSVHPAFYSTRKQCGFSYVNKDKFSDFNYIKTEQKISVVIGNDVWIGEGVRILEGVTIGDGAIVASGAIVTKNVPPFTIVGEVPAKFIKYRFNEEQIQSLMDIQWWNKGEQWISKHANLFSDIDLFCKSQGGYEE